MNDQANEQLLNSIPYGRLLLERRSRYVKLKEAQQRKLIRLTKIMFLGRWNRLYDRTSSEQASRLSKSIEFWGYFSEEYDRRLDRLLWMFLISTPSR